MIKHLDMLVMLMGGLYMGGTVMVVSLFDRFCFNSFCSSVVNFSGRLVSVLVTMAFHIHIVVMISSSDFMALMVGYMAVIIISKVVVVIHIKIVVVISSSDYMGLMVSYMAVITNYLMML